MPEINPTPGPRPSDPNGTLGLGRNREVLAFEATLAKAVSAQPPYPATSGGQEVAGRRQVRPEIRCTFADTPEHGTGGSGLAGSSVIKVEQHDDPDTLGGKIWTLAGEVAYLDADDGHAVAAHTLALAIPQEGNLSKANYGHDLTHLANQLAVGAYLDAPAQQTNGLVNEALNYGFFEAVKAHKLKDPAFNVLLSQHMCTKEGMDLQRWAELATGFGAGNGVDSTASPHFAEFAQGGTLGRINKVNGEYATTLVAERAIKVRFEALLAGNPGFAATYARNWSDMARAVLDMNGPDSDAPGRRTSHWSTRRNTHAPCCTRQLTPCKTFWPLRPAMQLSARR